MRNVLVHDLSIEYLGACIIFPRLTLLIHDSLPSVESCLHTWHLRCVWGGRKLIGKSKSDKYKCPLSPHLKNAGGSLEDGKATPQPGSSLLTEPPVCCLAPSLAVKGERETPATCHSDTRCLGPRCRATLKKPGKIGEHCRHFSSVYTAQWIPCQHLHWGNLESISN